MAKNVLNESQSEDFAPISTTSDAAEAKIGWYDATLNASFWLARNDLTPLEAATLLCQQNPHDDRNAPSLTSTDVTAPDDFKKLLRTFVEAERDGQYRTLKDWLSIAKDESLKYHPWIDGYLAANDVVKSTQREPSTSGDGSNLATCPYPCTNQEIIDGFILSGKNWDDILSRPNRDGKRFKDALVQPGKRGGTKCGKSNSALWNPVVFARLLIQNNDLNQGQVVARFKKTWPELEAEMMIEIGELST